MPAPPEGADTLAEPPAATLPVEAAAGVPLTAPLVVVETEAEPPAAALPVVAVALIALASMIVIWRVMVLVSVLAPGRWLSTLTAIW